MKKINFISRHLINKIEQLIIEKQTILNHKGFIYLDSPLIQGKKIINRLNCKNCYLKNEILPESYYSLDGQSLLSIYNTLKTNKVFIYREINGQYYKTRIKSK